MNIAINILIWAIGWFIMYGVMFLLHDNYEKWDNPQRLSAAAWSCFSWGGIVVIIILLAIALVCVGTAWLLKKIVSPPLEKYEMLVNKLKEWVINLFTKPKRLKNKELQR